MSIVKIKTMLILVALVATAGRCDPLNAQKKTSLLSNGSNPVVSVIEFAPDGGSFIAGSQNGVFHHVPDERKPAKILTELDNVYAIAFSRDGEMVAIAGGAPAVSGSIEIWSWPEVKKIRTIKAHRDVVTDLVWIAGDSEIVSASADNSIRVSNVDDGSSKTNIDGHSGPVLALAISPDDKLLCSGSVDQTIRVWNTDDWTLARTLNNHLGTVHDLDFRNSSNGDPATLASASEDRTVRIWYPSIGRMVRIVRHEAPVSCIQFTPDGRGLFSGSKDGKVRLLAGDTLKIAKTIELSSGWIVSLACSDRVIVGTSSGEIKAIKKSGRQPDRGQPDQSR